MRKLSEEFYLTLTHKLAAPLAQQAAHQLVAHLTRWRLHTPHRKISITARAMAQSR